MNNISIAQRDENLNSKPVENKTSLKSIPWKVVRNAFLLSTLTALSVGSAIGVNALGFHVKPGEIALLMLIPGSSYALRFIPRGFKQLLAHKAKEAIEEHKNKAVEITKKEVEGVAGRNRPDLVVAAGEFIDNALAAVANKVSDVIDDKLALKKQTEKQQLVETSPKPLSKDEAIGWINQAVDGQVYPALNQFFKEACNNSLLIAVNLDEDRYDKLATDSKKWEVSNPTYQLLSALDKGNINFAAFMSKGASREVLQELAQYKSNHISKVHHYHLDSVVNPDTYPSLSAFLHIHVSIAQVSKDKDAAVFTIINQLEGKELEKAQKGLEALGLDLLIEEKEEFNQFITEKKQSLLNGVNIDTALMKDMASLGVELAQDSIHGQINQSYEGLFNQIDTLVNPEKYPDLYAFLHLSNDAIHQKAAKELQKVADNKDNFLFGLIDDLQKGQGVKHLDRLISMKDIPAEVMKDVMALGIEVGGDAAEEKIKDLITHQIKSLYVKEGNEWSEKVAEEISKNAGALIQKLKEKATTAIRSEHAKPGFYERTMASWTMSGPWSSGAHLAFANPESGVDVLVRLGAAMVGSGGLVSSAATELISSLIPEEVHNSSFSKKIAERLQAVAKPAKAASEWIESNSPLTDKGKKWFLQAAAITAFSREGVLSNLTIAAILPALGVILDRNGIAKKEHFEVTTGLEEQAIRIWLGGVTTVIAEGLVRPAFEDDAAYLTYLLSNFATTLMIPIIKESPVWQKVKDIAYEGSVSAASHIWLTPKEDEVQNNEDPWASYVEDATSIKAEEKPSLISQVWSWVTKAPEDEEELRA